MALNVAELEAVLKFRDEASTQIANMRKELDTLNTKASESNGFFGAMSGAVVKLAGVIGAAFSIKEIVAFAGEVVNLAGEINDMADKLGISTGAVQRFKFAAEQTGGSIGDVGTAITNMSKALAAGDTGAIAALSSMGLSFHAIRAMKPEDAFTTIADAIGKIRDPMEQARVATEVFGRSGAALLPAIKAGFVGVGDAADVMADDTIKALDEAGDAWSTFSLKLKVVTGTLLGDMMRATDLATDSWSDFFGVIGDIQRESTRLGGGLFGMAAALGVTTRAASLAKAEMLALADQVAKVKSPFEDMNKAMAPLPDITDRGMEAFQEWNKEVDEAQRLAEAHTKAIKALRDELSGAALKKDIDDLREAWRGLTPEQQADKDVVERLVEKYDDLRARIGAGKLPADLEAVAAAYRVITPEVIAWDLAQGKITGTLDTLRFSTLEHIGTLETLPLKLQETSDTYEVMGRTMEETAEQQENLKEKTIHWRDSLGELSNAVGGMGDAIGGSFGEIVSAVGEGIKVVEQFDKATQQMANAQNWAQMAAGFTNAASAMVTGFMMLAQAIDKSQHNKLVEDMMEKTGRRYGLQLTRGMAEALVADIRLGENLGDLILRNLDQVLADQGGATKRNYENFARILLDAMNEGPPGGNKDRAWIARHLAEIEDTMNEVFPALAQVVIDSNTFAGESFLELIKRENELGVNTEAVTEFMRDRMSVAAEGLQTFVENAAVTSQAAAEGMVGAVVAMFDTMIQRGVPMTEILKQLDPVIVKLQEQFTAAGLSGGDAFAEVTRLATLARDEVAGPALTAVGGLNQALIAMQQSGMLNQQTFEGLARQVADTFNSLVAQGKSGDDILRLMQPTLQTIWELQQEFGYAVDEATQNLIDQAVEAGVVGDTHRDAQEKIAAAMQHVADTLDAIAIALGAIAPAAEDAAEGVEDAVRRLPTHIEIPVDFPTRGGPEFPVPVPADPENSFATGSGGFRDFGRGTWAMLHGKEKVVPASGPGSESGGETSREMRELYHLLKSLPTQVTMGVRGGIARSRRSIR